MNKKGYNNINRRETRKKVTKALQPPGNETVSGEYEKDGHVLGKTLKRAIGER